MPDDQTTVGGAEAEAPLPHATDVAGAGGADLQDIARRLKAIVTEFETGVASEPADLLTPSEKLRAIADLIDRRAAAAARSNDS